MSPEIAPSRLITVYVAGWFDWLQLYVNRGIGTILIRMRLGAPPEITVFELSAVSSKWDRRSVFVVCQAAPS